MCKNQTPATCLNWHGLRQTANFHPEQLRSVPHGQETHRFTGQVVVPQYRGAGYGVPLYANSRMAFINKPLIQQPHAVTNAPAQKVISPLYFIPAPQYTLTAVNEPGTENG